MKFLVAVLLVWVSGVAQAQTDDFESQRQALLSHGDLKTLASGNEEVFLADSVPKGTYENLANGQAGVGTYEIDCLPVQIETEGGEWSQVLAFCLDETGFGYRKDQPVVLLAPRTLALGEKPLLRVLATPVWAKSPLSLGLSNPQENLTRVPVLRVLASVSHSSWD